MSGREPAEIWEASVSEGRRRLGRTAPGLLATGFVGGADVMLGILALTVTSGALHLVMPEGTAHVLASLTFGVGFAFIVIGRSELFTENFLVPIVTVLRGGHGWSSVARLWVLTFIGNTIALLLGALILVQAGLVPPETLKAAATMAETFADRSWQAALLSAILAGATMTLMTWLTHAVDDPTTKVLIALLIGFVLAAPTLNHAVVSVGEMAFGILTGDSHATWGDVAWNLPIAIAGNLIGGMLLVTAMRLLQVQGEPKA